MEVNVVVEGSNHQDHSTVANRVKVGYPPGAYCAVMDEIGEPEAPAAGWVGLTIAVSEDTVVIENVPRVGPITAPDTDSRATPSSGNQTL
jgi:hypothetical protein